jgi:predicted lipoprotein
MQKKGLKYSLLILVAGLLAYNSVYFKKLEEKKATVQANHDPVQFARTFWKDRFNNYLDSAVDIKIFSTLLNDDPAIAFTKYAKTQGIGNTSCFLLKGRGQVTSVQEDHVVVSLDSGSDAREVELNTGLYFGNAVRDVTGMIKMGDFGNTIDYNSVSAELNKIVQSEVIKGFKATVEKGHSVDFIGCAEINKEQVGITNGFKLLPLKISIIK